MAPPLVVYVAWHPENEAGRDLARHVYTRLAHDVTDAAARGPGVPVYFRSAPRPKAPAGTAPLPIDLDAAKHSVVVVLVDDRVVVDEAWRSYVEDLVRKVTRGESPHRIIPVALSPHAYNLPPDCARVNFLRLQGMSPAEQPSVLVPAITHECVRLLRRDAAGGAVSRPIRVFLSHAKKDGLPFVTKLDAFIGYRTGADIWFDTSDIPAGAPDFGREIEDGLRDTAVVIVQTDAYGSREWCQAEVLWAKAFGRPAVVVNAVARGEERIFPYIGNLPSLRWDPAGPDRSADVIDALFAEVLRDLHFRARMADSPVISGLGGRVRVLGRAPELAACLGLVEPGAPPPTIVYPDPPIPAREARLIAQLAPGAEMITPSSAPFLRAVARAASIEKWAIAVSIGDSPDLAELGLERIHLDHAAVEIARHLLALGARLAYGGSLGEATFSQLLADVVAAHNRSEGAAFSPIESYLAWSRYPKDIATVAALMNKVRIVPVPLPAHADEAAAIERGPGSTAWAYTLARAMTAMREAMTAALDARIVVGGKLVGFSGRYPGIVEEAFLTLRAGKPLFVLGAFGGAAELCARALRGEETPELDRAYQAARAPGYAPMLELHDSAAAAHGIERVDYEAVRALFAEKGPGGLGNGLDAAENLRLMKTADVEEAITLMLQGLARLCEGASPRA
jgi:hypothetical protein